MPTTGGPFPATFGFGEQGSPGKTVVRHAQYMSQPPKSMILHENNWFDNLLIPQSKFYFYNERLLAQSLHILFHVNWITQKWTPWLIVILLKNDIY